jgi:hypothetical protein
LSLWRFGPDAVRRIRLLSAQRRAMAFSTGEGTIAFTTNDKDVKKCLSLGSSYTSLHQYDAGLIVTPWRDFYARYSPPGGPSGAAFCHELTSPSGNKRLVVVNIGDRTMNELSMIGLYPAVFIPGSLLTTPKQVLMSGFGTTVHGWGTTIYMGTVDPSDASHFTIDIDTGGVRDTIDGYLLDNDTVTLEPRSAGTSIFPKATTAPAVTVAPPLASKPPAKRRKKRKH